MTDNFLKLDFENQMQPTSGLTQVSQNQPVDAAMVRAACIKFFRLEHLLGSGCVK